MCVFAFLASVENISKVSVTVVSENFLCSGHVQFFLGIIIMNMMIFTIIITITTSTIIIFLLLL